MVPLALWPSVKLKLLNDSSAGGVAALQAARAPGAALRGDSGGNDTDVMGMLAGIEEPPGIHLPAVLLVVLLLLDPADLAVQVTSVVPGAVLASVSDLVFCLDCHSRQSLCFHFLAMLVQFLGMGRGALQQSG